MKRTAVTVLALALVAAVLLSVLTGWLLSRLVLRRIGEIAQQRNMMRSRQSVAEAMRTINNIEGVSYGEIEDTFDRWEINLGETEILMGAVNQSDAVG